MPPPPAGMASRGASNPLAPFTKDFFVTAKGGDVLKRLSMVYGVLSKLEQADDGSHPAGIDSVSAGVSQSAEIRLSKDNVCGTVSVGAAFLGARHAHPRIPPRAGGAHDALLRRGGAVSTLRAAPAV